MASVVGALFRLMASAATTMVMSDVLVAARSS
jgi:hypothetical protein